MLNDQNAPLGSLPVMQQVLLAHHPQSMRDSKVYMWSLCTEVESTLAEHTAIIPLSCNRY